MVQPTVPVVSVVLVPLLLLRLLQLLLQAARRPLGTTSNDRTATNRHCASRQSKCHGATSGRSYAYPASCNATGKAATGPNQEKGALNMPIQVTVTADIYHPRGPFTAQHHPSATHVSTAVSSALLHRHTAPIESTNPTAIEPPHTTNRFHASNNLLLSVATDSP